MNKNDFFFISISDMFWLGKFQAWYKVIFVTKKNFHFYLKTFASSSFIFILEPRCIFSIFNICIFWKLKFFNLNKSRKKRIEERIDVRIEERMKERIEERIEERLEERIEDSLFWLPWLCKTGWRLIYDRNCDNSQIRQIAWPSLNCKQ